MPSSSNHYQVTSMAEKELQAVNINAIGEIRSAHHHNTPQVTTIGSSQQLVSSISTQRSFPHRYSTNDVITHEVLDLAMRIFTIWDTNHKGFVTINELTLENADPTFTQAIARVLGFQSDGRITVENLAEVLGVLQHGELSAKVKLLMQFMDSNGNGGEVSMEEIKEYLRFVDDKMLHRLGFNVQRKFVLYYEDILSLFQDGDRGDEAMKIFCDQILRILENSSMGYTRHLASSIPIEKPSMLPLQASQVMLFKMALVALQIMLWLYYFFYHKQRGFPLSFCIAKGFGLNLRILTLLVYFTMARTTMGHLYAFKVIRPFIPLGMNIEVHSFIGFALFLHSFGHTFGHIAYKQMETEKGFSTAFTQQSLLRGYAINEKLKGDGETGMLLLVFIVVMALTALFRSFSSKHYKLFLFTHFLYLLWLPMIFLHIPQLWQYFLAITALIVAERVYDLLQSTLYTTLSASRPCANGITFLSIPRYGMQTYPGSYYRIRIPAISYEWHPFSLAGNTSSHHLHFFIASAGDWTRALHQLVSDADKRQVTLVQVQGPFLAPASQALIRKPKSRILAVATGIGITPFFSLMATKVMDELNYESDRKMYASLFHESSFGKKATVDSKNSLLQVLQAQWKVKGDGNGTGASSLRRESSAGMLLSGLANTIMAVRRDTSSRGSFGSVMGSPRSPRTPRTPRSHHSSPYSPRSPRKQIKRVEPPEEWGVGVELEADGMQEAIKERREVGGVVEEEDEVPPPPPCESLSTELMPSRESDATPDHHVLPDAAVRYYDDDDEEEEDDSLLKVVWSIRELSELSFYVDYVHHLVGHQDQFLQGDEEAGEVSKKRRKRVVVEVEVYLTGLGSKTDPVYMLSQTLFLLSIAHMSSAFMKVHFERPDVNKIVQDFHPEEVYYCGGRSLKNRLNEVCHDLHVPFHPEDFDIGGGDFVRGAYAFGKRLLKALGIAAKSRKETKDIAQSPEQCSDGKEGLSQKFANMAAHV